MTRVRRRVGNEDGVALVLALFLAAAASAIGASLMYLSQTETFATSSYRVMTQARYGAEAGVHKALNFLTHDYLPPTAAQLAASYVTTVSPVTYNGNPVILSANPNKAANYPDAAQRTAFAANASGILTADHVNIRYQPYATLLSARVINGTVVLAWEVTSVGKITVGASTAEVEVSSSMEKQVTSSATSTAMYAAFATAPNCGALKFTGNGGTDSYDSSALVAGAPVISNTAGNVGTNGNMTESGNATIKGTLSTPRVGVGSCSVGNVDALTSSGSATLTGGVIQLPQTVNWPAPTVPNPPPPTTLYSGNNQTLLTGASVGNVTVGSNKTLTLGAAGVTSTINMNTLKLSGNANIVVLGTVILNIVGTGDTDPIDLTGGTFANSTYVASRFTINYAGTGTAKLAGGSGAAIVLNAPNAAVTFSGNADIYGSIIGKTVAGTGNGKIHFDRALSASATTITFSIGHDMLSAFTWKKS